MSVKPKRAGITSKALHNPSYNLTDNPYVPKHDNSNTFILRILAAAIGQNSDPAAVQRVIDERFEATEIRLGTLTLLALGFSDRSDLSEQRYAPQGRAIIVDYSSLRDFLAQEGHLAQAFPFYGDLVSVE